MINQDLDQRIQELKENIVTLSKEVTKDEAARKKLLGVSMQAMSVLETPVETIWRMMMSPCAPSALMAILEMGGVEAIVRSEKPLTAEELGSITGADHLLIVRLMRPLVALGIFKETDVETYTSTPISSTLTAPSLIGGYQVLFASATKSLAYMQDYLAWTGFKHVYSPPGPFQYAYKENSAAANGFFPWLNSDPAMLTNFNALMSGQRANRKEWYDSVPVDEILLDGAEKGEDTTLLIDIAGGEGHDAEAFHKRFPDVPGRIVLQDQPATIDNIKHLDPAITPVKYDFFTPQPIKGARAYYFRGIFHDWPDAECVKILQNTASAMTKGYSKLLIFEWVLPAKDVPLHPALLDISMMALLSSMERTEAQWRRLLDLAGFKVVKFWTVVSDTERLIEKDSEIR
ncbi:hypothetical protein MMC13_005589 [Lambiella insularis]|nr:hypothetical protein [Lambiella insularis]